MARVDKQRVPARPPSPRSSSPLTLSRRLSDALSLFPTLPAFNVTNYRKIWEWYAGAASVVAVPSALMETPAAAT
ncbi:hypothetical protein WOLCODRAFT_147512 [Wolfiporia cocos MD-104 SS10]|uniref:Uncharacterized protein n=1 Tax=Wolfiporia cocos (strain MD-104) TaxID=742152 RepID=A0A2H3J9T3_WOLCO|nr:hypothetical protein WOLCODRAFT_147512 [Wolfiporia cocos MD-104 SS10]